MKLENLFSTALCTPSDYTAYYVSGRLAELYPDKAIVEGITGAFHLENFIRDGHCSVVNYESIHNQVTTNWRGLGYKLEHQVENAVLSVLWQGHLLDVVLMTWIDDGYKSRGHWILADAKAIAENFFSAVCKWSAEVVFSGGDWRKSEELFEAIKGASFDNLILPEPLKREIQSDFERFFASREMYEKYGIPWKRGMLLIGPPGNGKTHTVKALINQLKRPRLYVKSVKSHYDTEHDNLRAVFQRARQSSPCIIVMEDLDSLIEAKSRSFFLNEMDGFESNSGVVVIATTNYPERLDPAILDRPSRFDRKYYFNLPGPDERLEYFMAWHQSLQAELQIPECGIAEIIAQTEGFSFAYLKEMFLSSLMQWISADAQTGMDEILVKRATVLRQQMRAAAEPARSESGNASDDEES